MKIYKYPVDAEIQMPFGAEVLTVQMQNNEPMIWAMVNENNSTEPKYFRVFGTGQSIPAHYGYIGTYQEPPFVWHLFEEI